MPKISLLPILAALQLAAGAAYAADGDPKEGEEVFKVCRACHQVGPTAKNALGPILNGIVGRKAGTIEGFNYSPANLKAGEDGWVWTEASLMKYLENPKAAMPGNRMAFAGVKDEQDRLDLIAFLKSLAK